MSAPNNLQLSLGSNMERSAAPADVPFRFMDLPAEVRAEVYRYLLVRDRIFAPFEIPTPPDRGLMDTLQILRTSHRVYTEAVDILLVENHFFTRSEQYWPAFVMQPGSPFSFQVGRVDRFTMFQQARLRELTLKVDDGHVDDEDPCDADWWHDIVHHMANLEELHLWYAKTDFGGFCHAVIIRLCAYPHLPPASVTGRRVPSLIVEMVIPRQFRDERIEKTPKLKAELEATARRAPRRALYLANSQGIIINATPVLPFPTANTITFHLAARHHSFVTELVDIANTIYSNWELRELPSDWSLLKRFIWVRKNEANPSTEAMEYPRAAARNEPATIFFNMV